MLHLSSLMYSISAADIQALSKLMSANFFYSVTAPMERNGSLRILPSA